MPIENFDYRKYREGLAAQVKREKSPQRRREFLKTTKATEEYEAAKILHKVGGKKEKLGINSKDYDIEVYNIAPEKLKELAKNFGRVNEVGAAFGILKVCIGAENFESDRRRTF